jgi:hypothetical protein
MNVGLTRAVATAERMAPPFAFALLLTRAPPTYKVSENWPENHPMSCRSQRGLCSRQCVTLQKNGCQPGILGGLFVAIETMTIAWDSTKAF